MTPDVMMTRYSPANFSVWVRRSFTFVARQHWLKSCVSPPGCGAHFVKTREPYHSPLMSIYANCNLQQTAINCATVSTAGLPIPSQQLLLHSLCTECPAFLWLPPVSADHYPQLP